MRLRAEHPSANALAQRRYYLRNKEKKARYRREVQLVYLWRWQSRRYAERKGFTIVEEVDPMKVYMRDGGICQICGEHVDLRLKGNSRYGPQMDHTAPVHSYETIQLTHMTCNRRMREERRKNAFEPK